MLQKIHHKKNELFEVEFFQNEECTVPFDFTNAKNLYIDGLNGDVTPLYSLIHKGLCGCIYMGYIPKTAPLQSQYDLVKTLDDITPNLSKYIPEDNAVLFLSEESLAYYFNNNKNPLPKSIQEQFYQHISEYIRNGEYIKYKYFIYNTLIRKFEYEAYQEEKYAEENDIIPYFKNFNHNQYLQTLCNQIGLQKVKIFLPHGTQCELQKANEVAKELKEKYGVEELNLFVLHCFVNILITSPKNSLRIQDTIGNTILGKPFAKEIYFNKIITTNSTGILPVQDTERLQVIDCFDIFQDHLNNI